MPRRTQKRSFDEESSFSSDNNSRGRNSEERNNEKKKETKPYVDTTVVYKRMIFGSFVGGTTGSLLAGIDAYRSASARSTFAETCKGMMKAAPRGGVILGAFFGGYNLFKYTLALKFETDNEFLHPGIAAGVSIAPLIAIKSCRGSLPYAGALVLMDQLGERGII